MGRAHGEKKAFHNTTTKEWWYSFILNLKSKRKFINPRVQYIFKGSLIPFDSIKFVKLCFQK